MSASALGSPVRGMEEALLGGLRECPPESPLSLDRQQILTALPSLPFCFVNDIAS